jgi:hypothetical protein
MSRVRQASASFFEKKEAKKLSLLRALAPTAPTPTVNKSFLVTFFQKSNCFPSSLTHGLQP